ncbi:dephospho-CoA kinase [Anaerotignum sp.]|nr:dephospho-CoA kinase [Anaerotignum sp.]MBQ7757439.1 dephospho-CoA kinase [Anaerotignum sp.]
MKVIGLTGGTGSGKSVVSKSLAAAGAVIIDADKIAHEIILKGEPAYMEIIEYYGTGILDDEKNIIRKKLGEIVFNDKEKLAFLNQCTHKYITAEVKRQIAAAKEEGKAAAIIVDAPLLLEAGLEKVCDLVWVVYAEPEVRAQRVMARDGITYELAKARIANQKSWEEYRQAADAVIDNSKDLEHLEGQLAEILKTL